MKLFLPLFFAFFVAFHGTAQSPAYTNALIHERSPYLLQHAHNPVNWYPWGEEALAKAKAEDKMLLVSIGYSACHWCHVMGHESFEDTAIARLMNTHFVCIKVDREERPDIDKLYMNAALLTNGETGWPLNGFALPDGSPFFAGTYYTPEQWTKMLTYITHEYATDREKIEETSKLVTNGIHSVNEITPNTAERKFSLASILKSYAQLYKEFDREKGGKLGTPKFPTPSVWKGLLQYAEITKDTSALEQVNRTLMAIANGGINDHLGGGFSRYATDADWNIPHFEKMLYDNAQLVELYCLAWQKTKKPLYKEVVFETLDFIDRHMTAANGGFYSSLDADSEREEGKYYVWTSREIDSLLKKDATLFKAYYAIHEEGNWEAGKNILRKNPLDAEIARKEGMTLHALHAILDACEKKLVAARKKRVQPTLDDKILTSWNALTLKAYVRAYRTFGEKRFLKTAKKNAHFLLDNMIDESGSMKRSYNDGTASISAFMDDYAFVISSFIDLYEATFDQAWLDKANSLTNYSIAHFQDTTTQLFMFSPVASEEIIVKEAEIYDQVIPSSNSEMAINLIRLGHYYTNAEYLEMAEQMVSNIQPRMAKNPYFYSNWLRAEQFLATEPFEVAITGKNALNIRQEMDQYYLPFVFFYGAKKSSSLESLAGKFVKGKTTIYVCQYKSCKAPTQSVEKALEQLRF